MKYINKILILFIIISWTNLQGMPLLIEGENFNERICDDEDFAKVRNSSTASGKKVLFRLIKDGYVSYKFKILQDKEYTIWIRYTSNNSRKIPYAFDKGNKIKWKRTDIQATDKKGAKTQNWTWKKISSRTLEKGEHSFTLGKALIHLDCIYITDNNKFIPTDDVFKKKISQKERELLAKKIIPIQPDWLKDTGGYKLPDWFDSHRVQLHTRLSIKRSARNPEIFYKAAEHFKKMGVKVFSRHIVSGGEGAWWPSKVGEIHELAKDRNVAKEIIDETHKQGLRIIPYNRHIEDDWAAETHPDWRCVDWDGSPIMASRGINMCQNSPFADYTLQRQLELVDMGADGFFYDHVHMPRGGCWCKYCKKKFKELTGLDHPEKENTNDPLWHKLKEFNNYTMALTFLKWRKALHKKNPELVMVVGSNLWPCISDKHMDHRIFRIIDCHKTEFNKGTVYKSPRTLWQAPPKIREMEKDIRLAFGFAISRDVTDGRPAHVWAHRIKYESHALAASAGIVTHGCIANLDVQEGNIPDMNFRSSFDLGEMVSPYLAGSLPVKWVAILHSEYARDLYGLEPDIVWKKFLYPIHGAFTVLIREHLPVGFIFDSQLEQGNLDQCKVLFIPDPKNLTDKMKTVIDKFKSKGGTVIYNNPNWEWHKKEGWKKAVKGFKDSIAKVIPTAPVQVSGGNEKMHMTTFYHKKKDQLTICLANDFSWVQIGGKGEEGYVEGDTKESVKEKPAPCKNVKINIRFKNGNMPKKLFNAVTGKKLKATKDRKGLLITIPEFEYMAVVVAQY